MKPLCIHHSPCADGFTAAWVVHRAFPDADFLPGDYAKPPLIEECKGRDVIMVDFTYKKPVLEELAVLARSVLVLDHHKTAQADLTGFLQAPPLEHWRKAAWDGLLGAGGRVAVQFDMDRSGAQMTWDYFFGAERRPALIDYVGDRDLWRFDLKHSRLVNAYIFANAYNFANWDRLAKKMATTEGLLEVAESGAAIEMKHHKDIAELVAALRRTMIIGGREVPVANLPYTLTSDAGHAMAVGHPSKMAGCFWLTPSGWVFSLRSTEDGPDVALIAANYGGGGHKHAAGFQIPLDRLAEFVA